MSIQRFTVAMCKFMDMNNTCMNYHDCDPNGYFRNLLINRFFMSI